MTQGRDLPAVTVVLAGRVPHGGEAALAEFLADAVPFYEEPGGISVRLEWDETTPGAFREIIDYESERDYDLDADRVANNATMKGLLDRWHALLDGEPEVTVHRRDA